ncbi:MAG: hypothetical protein HYZ54_05735 [Ignavibacteriae bacterium]|nr:hypothetical protein [Ignavibacteriota bacterium]
MISVSPLFAVQAEQLILEGHPSEAIELCLDGLEYYYDYPIAYIVAARAYLVLDDQTKALTIIDRALSLFPLFKPLLNFYEEITNPVTKSSLQELDTQESDSKTSVLDVGFNEAESELPAPEIANSEVSTEISGLQNFMQEQHEPLELEIESLDLHNEVSEQEHSSVETEATISELETSQESKSEVFGQEFLSVDLNPDIVQYKIEDREQVEPESTIVSSEVISEVLEKDHVKSVSKGEDAQDGDIIISQKQFSPLRIIETVKAPPYFIGSIKSTSINIISGLEFAPLRVENGGSFDSSLDSLSELPSFPKFLRKSNPANSQSTPATTNKSEDEQVQKKRTPLEELAARLEKVRIPVTHQENVKNSTPSQIDPTMVTETMAMIYEKQGAYSEAIKAYQILARRTPEKLDFYEQKIREVMNLIA